MPEIPDLHVIAERLDQEFSNQVLDGIEFLKEKKAIPSTRDIANSCQNSKLERVVRDGKQILFKFDNGNNLRVHLMLKGRIELSDRRIPSSFFHMCFGDRLIHIYDPTSWASAELISDLDISDEIPDALNRKAFTNIYFAEIAAKYPKKKIKTLLIDQKIIRGIGNAYSDEILWEANVHPASVVGKIPINDLENIHDCTFSCLQRAIEELRKIEDFSSVIDHRSFFNVHIKGAATTPNGFDIQSEKIDTKMTYFTEGQKLFE